MMMMKLAAVLCMLALTVVSSDADNKLNCAGIRIESLESLRGTTSHPCNQVRDYVKNDNFWDNNPYKRIQLVRECLCTMMQQQSLWDIFADANVVYLFKKVRNLLDVQGDEEDVLNGLDEHQRKAGYPLSTYLEDKEKVNKACARLNGEFAKFYAYIYNSSILSGSPNLTYKVATYDKSYYRCMVAWRSCKPVS